MKNQVVPARLPKDMVEYLKGEVRSGRANDMSDAVRQAIKCKMGGECDA
jgi:Arc/MetJ-type ribon-helix-helix transcriptional regulator